MANTVVSSLQSLRKLTSKIVFHSIQLLPAYCPAALCVFPGVARLRRAVFCVSIEYLHSVLALFVSTQSLFIFCEYLIRQTLPRHLKVAVPYLVRTILRI